MALELEGTIRQKLGVQSGMSARGAWSKQEFVLEYPDGNYTSQVCMLAFGQDKVQELEKYQVGDRVKVAFNIKSREYNGRWYTDVQIWRISPAGATAPAAPAAAPAPAAMPKQTMAAAPVYDAPAYAAPAPTLEDMPGEDVQSDDLPF